MPVIKINGEEKKVACGPCIRGHRSTKCEHKDRILLEVRKPGRPLSSCPHSAGNCSCNRVAFTYALPKNVSHCACPSTSEEDSSNGNAPQPTTPPTRVQKNRHKKSISSRSPGTLERALKAREDAKEAVEKNDTVSSARKASAKAEDPSNNGTLPHSSSNSAPPVANILPRPSSHGSRAQAQDKSTRPEHEPMEVQPRAASGGCCSSHPKVDRSVIAPVEPDPVQKSEPPDAPRPRPASLSSGGSQAEQPMQHSCCSGRQGAVQNNTHTQLPQNQPAALARDDLQRPQASSLNMAHPALHSHSSTVGQSQEFSYGNIGHIAPYTTSMPLVLDQSTFAFQPVLYQHHQGSAMPQVQLGAPDGSISSGVLHNCTCGDACACLGCAAHPTNDTTINYIRQMADFMLHQSPVQTPYLMQQSPYLVQTPLQQHFNGHMPQIMPFTPLAPPFFTAQSTPLATYGHATSGSARPQFAPTTPTQAAPAAGLEQFDLLQSQPQPYSTAVYPSQPTTTEPPGAPVLPHASLPTQPPEQDLTTTPEKDAPMTTELSPTSFFFNELVLGCSDATGLCQCGDGCTCVGCLTHGGHNGVALDSPNALDLGGLSFDTTSGLGGGLPPG